MKITKPYCLIKPCVLIIAFFCISNTQAQEDSTKVKSKKPFHPKYYISTGIFTTTVSTTFQINGEKGPGTILSLEDGLGFSAHPLLWRADGTAYFTKRSSLQLSYVGLNRSQDWTVDRDITIRDSTYHLGAHLGIFFNTTFISGLYQYSVFSHPEWNAGLAIGIEYLQIKTGFDVETTNFSDKGETVSVPAPVPVLGVFGSGYLMKNLRIQYNFSYFRLSVSGISGGVIGNRIGLEYYFIKNLGLGCSANFLDYDVKEIPLAKNFHGEFKYSLNGLSLYLTSRF